MKITRDNCNNVAYSLEPDGNSVQQISYGPKSETLAYIGSPIFDENFESLYQYALTLI